MVTQKDRQERKGGRRFFWLALIVILLAIATTVLLANDKENLRRLMAAIGHPLPGREMAVPRPGSKITPFKPQPITGLDVHVPERLVGPEIVGYTAGFLRTVFKDTATICAALKPAGIKISALEKSPLAADQSECTAFEELGNLDNPAEPSTFFLMIRADGSGLFKGARVKIVSTSIPGRTRMTTLTADAADALAQATGWLELSEQRLKIEQLTPFQLAAFGTDIQFKAEFGGPGRYNLIIMPKAETEPQKRTLAFFNRRRFLPLPPPYSALPGQVGIDPPRRARDGRKDLTAGQPEEDPSASEPVIPSDPLAGSPQRKDGERLNPNDYDNRLNLEIQQPAP